MFGSFLVPSSIVVADESQERTKTSPTNQPISQPTNQPTNQPANQQTNQPTNRQATNQSTNQPISRPMNHGADLANYFQNKRLRPSLPRKLIIQEKKMTLKVALNQLKIKYDEVKTPKLPRPCTLACICKIIWVSDSGQVGEWSSKFQNHTGREAYEKIMLNFNLNKDFPVN